MKTTPFFLIIIFLLATTSQSLSQNKTYGFFASLSGSLLLLDGEGQYENEDLNVIDDLFIMTVEEDLSQMDINIEYPGWGWSNKQLYGIKPVLGYQFSHRLAVMGSYTYYFQKKSEQSDSYTSLYVTGLNLSLDASMEYSQNSVQILGQFYPLLGKGFFIIAGMEFVFLGAELNYTFAYSGPDTVMSYPWKAKGDDTVTGFLIGGGFEYPLSSKNITIFSNILYSFTNYEGNKLLKVQESTGAVPDPNMNVKLNVGGLIVDLGLRVYFNH